MPNVKAKKPAGQHITSSRVEREWRKQAMAQGIPDFMLRLAAAQPMCFLPTKTMPRHRHE